MTVTTAQLDAEAIEAWMAAHSTAATRKRNEARVRKFRRAAMTPSRVTGRNPLFGRWTDAGQVVALLRPGQYWALSPEGRFTVVTKREILVEAAA